jgi:hypothetical protein
LSDSFFLKLIHKLTFCQAELEAEKEVMKKYGPSLPKKTPVKQRAAFYDSADDMMAKARLEEKKEVEVVEGESAAA